jgi:nitronate monooxygenase
VECNSSDAYKQAILEAREDDIVLSERVTGIPLAVINTPYVQLTGTKASALGRWLLRNQRTNHWMRAVYTMRSFFQLKRASIDESGTKTIGRLARALATLARSCPPAMSSAHTLRRPSRPVRPQAWTKTRCSTVSTRGVARIATLQPALR